jgi:ATP-dependent Lon protease
MPDENQRDFNELKDFIKEGVEVHFVKNYEDIYKIIFLDDNHSSTQLASPSMK